MSKEIINNIFDFAEIKGTKIIKSPTSEKYRDNSVALDKKIKITQEEYSKASFEAGTHYLN